jgi:Cellulase (glycosyl hydrolase family 5)
MKPTPRTIRTRRLATWLVPPLLIALALSVPLGAPTSIRAQELTPTPAQTSSGSDYYGINFIQPRQPWLTIGFNSGARIVRWQFNWRDIEPDSGRWTWDNTDSEISAWNFAGLKIHAILHNPPDFALAVPGTLVPSHLESSWAASDSSFARYCNQFAARYRGRIASYEVWNEPDLNVYWGGSAQQYYTLLKGCYQGIKAADPETPVAMAGMAYVTNTQFFTDVVQASAHDPEGPANNNFFDVMAVHMYSDPELIYKSTLSAREVLSANGMGNKPIWITETNVPLWGLNGAANNPRHGMASPVEASWYVLQAASNAIAAGAGKLMFFRLADDNMAGEAWGLVDNNASPRPAYRALQLASNLLHDITQAQRTVIDSDVVVTDMQRKDGARIVTAYSRSGHEASVTVKGETPAAVLVDSSGGSTPLVPDSAGDYTFSLPAAPGRDFTRLYNYTVGGPVLLLVEYDHDPPVATLETEALPVDKLHVLIHWHGDDGRFGTGVAKYSVEVSNNGADWQPWQTNTTDTQAIYDISSGGTFGFRARAIDKVGNVGDFSTPAVVTLKLVGTLSGHIVDLRGQDVASARVQLSDGSLYDADATGWVHIDLPPGTAQVTHIDAGIQGEAGQQAEMPIKLAEETTATWLVVPKSLIPNGDFSSGLNGWDVSSPADVERAQSSESSPQPVLQLSGQRRPWGPPAASITLSVPPEFSAGVLTFSYRLLGRGQTLRLRAIVGDQQLNLWQTDTLTNQRTRIWLDVAQLAGKTVSLRFELWGPKGVADTTAEIDDVVLGNVPHQPTPAPAIP